jgi:putative membrane protein
MALPAWHPHPDVWLIVLALEGGYLFGLRHLGPRPGPREEPPASRRQVVLFSLGVLTIWIAADWPIHDLAERYLFSIHMVQHMLIAFVAPPLMLLGMPAWLLRRMVSPRPVAWFVRRFARPFVAFVLFNLWIVLSHWPPVMDAMLEHHPLHFVGHVILFGTATLMWWPVVSPLPEMPTLSYPGRMMYLFLQSILPTVPASFLTFGSTPLYQFYRTVPRIWGLSVMTDQLISGLIMKLGGGAILWTVLAVIFFRWYAQEHASEGWDALGWRDVEHDIGTQMAKPNAASGAEPR